MKPQKVVLWTGAALILTGLALVVAQFWVQMGAPETNFPTRSLTIEGAGAKAGVNTTYVGLALVVVGAFLESLAFVATKPWQRELGDAKSDSGGT